ncbi:hypothetical protein GQ42DRAFT_53796 [Ramicandelaber brevisporus]|nr:hypothetical protein GQ42DRAFT_53796 [Ramicandelaber brevisporus]
MLQTVDGTIRVVGGQLQCYFETDHGAFMINGHLGIPIKHPFQDLPATLEYNEITDLSGQLKIGSGSLIGLSRIRLVFISETGKKAKITAKIERPALRTLKKEGGPAAAAAAAAAAALPQAVKAQYSTPCFH